METIHLYTLINKLRKRIKYSPGCDYLYGYFNDLVHELDLLEKDKMPVEMLRAIEQLIGDYAADCIYNTFASANWVRYSARCFYCADYLTRYLDEHLLQQTDVYLTEYFMCLTNAGVAPVLPKEIIDKYIEKEIKSKTPREIYDKLVNKAIDGCQTYRIWDANEVNLALEYLRSASRLITQYISLYSDYTLLKDWIPLMNIKRSVNIWYEYPDSANYRHSGRYTREAVSKYLDEMLDILLSIIDLWYSNNPQELIDKLYLEDIIEMLEVYEDEGFVKILRYMVTLPYSNKVERILEHFTHDDEPWVSNLSRNLLICYKKNI